jgi:hypothetical protein
MFCVGSFIYFRRVREYAFVRAAALGVAATVAAFALALGIWVGLGFARGDLPEAIFMIGGIINTPALAASAIVAMAMRLLSAARKQRAS